MGNLQAINCVYSYNPLAAIWCNAITHCNVPRTAHDVIRTRC